MKPTDSTCWTLIRGAAAGEREDRDTFARLYAPAVRAYLAARWRNSPHHQDLEDTVQEVFVECFKQGGVLDRADPGKPGGFRAFLYGVVRNVALRFEAGNARERVGRFPSELDPDGLEGHEEALSLVFDRAWARSVMKEAAALHAEQARGGSDAARRRVKLLRLRYQEGLSVADIAELWDTQGERLHSDFTRARAEFRAALMEVLRFHHPGSREERKDIEQEYSHLISLL